MSDQEKIWFVYLTDHHEGPFSVEEVTEKAKQGLVTSQTLAWRDGMAEWVAAETIPDLKDAFGVAAGAASASSAEGAGEVSLAQLLSSQQGEGESSAVELQGGSTALSSLVSQVQPALAPTDESEPGPEEEVWTMRVGTSVSGLHSLVKLKEMAAEGDIPADARLWRQGWTDFQLLSAVPAVASARRARPAGATRTSIKAIASRPGGIAPITAHADVGSDEPTDPQIAAPSAAKFSLSAALGKIFQRKPKAGAWTIGKKGRPGIGATAKKSAMLLVLLAALGGGGFAYFSFFSSPIPSNLDVLPDDKESLAVLVKEPLDRGKQFAVAQARGTEDSPADETSPKFYVGTNMPEGTKLVLHLIGKAGTLVNKVSFEKSFEGSVAKNHLATFELQDGGKPLPMGEYVLKILADGEEVYEANKFLGGKKGAVYDRRIKQYREKLEKEYADEVEELREFVSTLKNIQVPLEKHLEAFKSMTRSAAARTHGIGEWRAFISSFDGMTGQLETKLKARLEAPDQRYYPRAYQDIAATLGQLRQLAKANGERMGGVATAVNFDELQGLVQAGILSLDQVVAQAVVKTAFDVQRPGAGAPLVAAPAQAAPSVPAVPAAAPQR